MIRHVIPAAYPLRDESPPNDASVEQENHVSRDLDQLTDSLRASFESEPVEDGVPHPAELIVSEALSGLEQGRVLNWLRTLSLDAFHPSLAASVLRCLGRQASPGTVSWRVRLVRDALAVDDVEIRDAAAQAAELWGDPLVVRVLISHEEPERWLRDYISDVIDDLRE